MGFLGSWEIEVYVSAACACILLVVLMSIRKKSVHLPPSPPGWPIFGHLFILQQPLYRCLHALAQQYGPLFYIKMGSAPTVVISSAHWAREFLHVHDRELPNRPQVEVAKRIFYNNIGLSMLPYGAEWRHARKLFTTQLLTAKQFEMGEKSRQEEMALVIEAIQRRAAAAASMEEGISGTVDLRKVVFSTLGNIFTRMMFSKRCFDIEDALDGKGGRYKDLLQELLGLFGEPLLGDAIPWLTWLDTRAKRRMDRVAMEMDAFLEDVLLERIESRSSQRHTNPQDWLDVLLALYTQEDGNINKLQIKVALLDILIGGADTMGTPIDWAMAELLKSPRCLRKLQEELDTVVIVGVEGNEPKCLKDADIEKLSYLQAIVKETLRLHPSVAFTTREFSSTLNKGVQVGMYCLPKKTRVLISNWALGRDPTVWGRDADTFFPERFLDGLAPDIHGQNFEFLPFGAGRRMCPGMNIALKIVPFLVANLVHAVNWTIPSAIPLEFSEKCAFNNTMSNPLLVKPSLRSI